MNPDSAEPVYVSPPTFRSLWQTYRVYADRVELRCWVLLKTFVIPVEEIVDVRIIPPHRWLRPILEFFRGRWGLSLDWNIFYRHVRIERRARLIRYVEFTPDEPDRFAAAVMAALRLHNGT